MSGGKKQKKKTIKGEPTRILDTGSSENFIHPDKVKRLGLAVTPNSERILMTSSSHSFSTLGLCVVSLSLNGRKYSNVKLSVIWLTYAVTSFFCIIFYVNILLWKFFLEDHFHHSLLVD